MKVKSITSAGLILSIFGYVIVLAIMNLSPLSKSLSEQNLTLLGLMLIWVLVGALLGIVRWGEKGTLIKYWLQIDLWKRDFAGRWNRSFSVTDSAIIYPIRKSNFSFKWQ